MTWYEDGGVIPGSGGEHGDDTPAMIRAGCEYILTRRQLLTLGRSEPAQDRTEDRKAGDAR